MIVIPVIDLLDGQVVHARQGERQHYRPVVSALCDSSEPLPIMKALLALYPFRRIYVADINAIQNRGNHDSIIKQWADMHPGLDIWLDNGTVEKRRLREWLSAGVTPIIGSENLTSKSALLEIPADDRETVILSLDSNSSGQLGPTGLAEEAEYWPNNVIVMTLARVGSQLGPDFHYLERVLDLCSKRSAPARVYAAGGIRNTEDLQRLGGMGISGALIATAIHSGNITGEDISRLNGG